MTDPPSRPRLRVLDLFAGLGGWSAAFRDRKHDVVRVELDPDFKPEICADILKLTAADLPGPWDLVLASPPCEAFSVATIGRNWTDGKPSSESAELGLQLASKTLQLIGDLAPRAWIMENPRAMMRNLPTLRPFTRKTVTYCQYGVHYQKPTDLWGGFPPTLRLHKPCGPGDPCHEQAPRGAKAGTQGLEGSAVRAEVPYGLSMAVCMAMENWPTGRATRVLQIGRHATLDGA